MGLVRMLVLGGGIYTFFILGFPDWKASPYHFFSIALFVGGATAIHVGLKFMKVVSIVSLIIFELAFAGFAVLYLGYTMPTESGKPPVQQWAEGHKPRREHARAAFEKIGVNPKRGPAKAVVNFFPK